MAGLFRVCRRAAALSGVGIAVALGVSLPGPAAAGDAAEVLAEASAAERMAVERRKGLCRSLAGHLEVLHGEPERGEREEALGAMLRTASGLYNPYAGEAMSAESRASEAIWADDGARFREHREVLREEIRIGLQEWDPIVADRIEMTCAACHAEMTEELPQWGGSAGARRLGGSGSAMAEAMASRAQSQARE